MLGIRIVTSVSNRAVLEFSSAVAKITHREHSLRFFSQPPSARPPGLSPAQTALVRSRLMHSGDRSRARRISAQVTIWARYAGRSKTRHTRARCATLWLRLMQEHSSQGMANTWVLSRRGLVGALLASWRPLAALTNRPWISKNATNGEALLRLTPASQRAYGKSLRSLM